MSEKIIEHFLVFLIQCDWSDHSKDAQGDCGNLFVATHLKGTEKFKSDIKCNGIKFNVTLKLKKKAHYSIECNESICP